MTTRTPIATSGCEWLGSMTRGTLMPVPMTRGTERIATPIIQLTSGATGRAYQTLDLIETSESLPAKEGTSCFLQSDDPDRLGQLASHESNEKWLAETSCSEKFAGTSVFNGFRHTLKPSASIPSSSA